MIEMTEAIRRLNRIQKRAENDRIPCRICGTSCYLEARDGNMFRFTGTTMGDPSDNPAFHRLEKAGAAVWTAREGGACSSWTAMATWDTTLNYLVRTEDLSAG